jgi:predicted acetyltransferase
MSSYSVNLQPVTTAQLATLRNLTQLYFHDFSEFDGEDVNDFGEFEMPWLTDYFAEPRQAYFITASERLAGFVLVDEDVLTAEANQAVSEFFILRKYRRSNVGRAAIERLFRTRPGTWEAAVIRSNPVAAAFWKAIGQGSSLVECKQFEWNSAEWHGPVFVFRPRGTHGA